MKINIKAHLLIACLLSVNALNIQIADAGFLRSLGRSVTKTIKKGESFIRNVRDVQLRAAGNDLLNITGRVTGIRTVVHEAKKLKEMGQDFEKVVRIARDMIRGRKKEIRDTQTVLTTIKTETEERITEINDLEDKVNRLDDKELVIRGTSIALIRQVDHAYQTDNLNTFLSNEVITHDKLIEVNAQYFFTGIDVTPYSLSECLSELPVQDWIRTIQDGTSIGVISKETSLMSVEDCLIGATKDSSIMDRSELQNIYNGIQGDFFKKNAYQLYEDSVKNAFTIPAKIKTSLDGIRQGFYAIKNDAEALTNDSNNLNKQIENYENDINHL